MRTKENDSAISVHQKKAKKLKKLRRWQIVVSLLGIAIIVWGLIEVVCLFQNYTNRAIYLAHQLAGIGVY